MFIYSNTALSRYIIQFINSTQLLLEVDIIVVIVIVGSGNNNNINYNNYDIL